MTLDAAGRELHVGDRVGGTTSGRYQETIVGELVAIGKGQVKVRVGSSTRGSSGFGTDRGEEKWISTSRVFLVEHRE
jgi:hypothetical protein